MSFHLPVEKDPFSKRFFTIIIFFLFFFFIEFFVETILPGVLAVFLLGAIVLFCGNMLGFTHESPKKMTGVDSEIPVKAVDKKTLVKIETEIMEEMLRARRAKLEKLAKDD